MVLLCEVLGAIIIYSSDSEAPYIIIVSDGFEDGIYLFMLIVLFFEHLFENDYFVSVVSTLLESRFLIWRDDVRAGTQEM